MPDQITEILARLATLERRVGPELNPTADATTEAPPVRRGRPPTRPVQVVPAPVAPDAAPTPPAADVAPTAPPAAESTPVAPDAAPTPPAAA